MMSLRHSSQSCLEGTFNITGGDRVVMHLTVHYYVANTAIDVKNVIFFLLHMAQKNVYAVADSRQVLLIYSRNHLNSVINKRKTVDIRY